MEMRSSIYDALIERGRPVSKRAVNSLLDDFLLRIVIARESEEKAGLGERLAEEVQALKAGLFEKPRNWEVQRVVEGLAPSGLPFSVGQVEFEFLDEPKLSALKMKTAARIRELKPRGDVESTVAVAATDLDKLRGMAIATLSVNAVDAEAAIQAAKDQLQITIDAINLFSPREPMGGWAFLPGDTMPQDELVMAFCEGHSLMPSFRRAGPQRKIPLNQIAKRPGFARVSEMLAKEAPNDLADKILASVRWAGRAQVEARREEAFLLYAIALESLVLQKEIKTELSYRLAIRCAQIGGGPALEDKKLVVDQIQSLYDLRSRIVHSGNFTVNEEELELMSRYAVSTLLILIQQEPFRSMTTVQQLENWFEAQLLSGGVARV